VRGVREKKTKIQKKKTEKNEKKKTTALKDPEV